MTGAWHKNKTNKDGTQKITPTPVILSAVEGSHILVHLPIYYLPRKVAIAERFFGDFFQKAYCASKRPRSLPYGDKGVFGRKNEKDSAIACVSGARVSER